MLKPEQISNAQFTLVGKGAYRAEEVDAFLKTAADSYSQLASQNAELIKKMSILAEKIEEYRAEEDTIKTTLITAERVAKQIRKEAEDEKAATVAAAQAEGSEIIEAARKNAKDFVDRTKATVQAYIDKAKADSEAAVAAADAQAQATIADANKKASEIIGDSERKLALYTSQASRLKSEVATYKTAVGDVCTKQISLLDTLPAEPVIEDLGEDAPAALEEPAEEFEEVFEEETYEAAAEEETVESSDAVSAYEEAPAEEVYPVTTEETSEREPLPDLFSAYAAEESVIEKAEEPEEEAGAVSEPETTDYFSAAFASDEPETEETEEPADNEADDEGEETEQEEEFTGFRINLDDIVDDDDDENTQSEFGGFFDF